MTLRSRLALILILILSAFLVLGAFYIIPLIDAHFNTMSQAQLRSMAEQVASNVQLTLDYEAERLDSLSRNVIMRSFPDISAQEIFALLDGAAGKSDLIARYAIIDREYRMYESDTLRGVELWSEAPVTRVPLNYYEWIEQSLREGHAVLSDVLVLPDDVGYIVAFFTPLYDATGTWSGMLMAEVNLGESGTLSRMLRTLRLEGGGEAAIVGSNGWFILDPSRPLDQRRPWNRDLSASGTVPGRQANKRPEILNIDMDGVLWYGALHPVGVSGWDVLVRQSAEVFQGRAVTMKITLLIFTMALFTLIGAIQLVFLNHALNPFFALVRSIKERKPVRPDTFPKNEIGFLGLEVHKLYSELQRHEEELERANTDLQQRVNERTEELRMSNDRLMREVAVRRQSEDELLRSRQRFRDVADNSGDWIWELDLQGDFIYSSSASKRVVGYRQEDLIGKHFSLLFPKEQRQALRTAFEDLFQKGERFRNMELDIISGRSEELVIELSGTPVLGEQQQILGYRGAARDVTGRVRMQQQLSESLQEKEVLLKEIHHRVKNNLQIVSSLLSLQSRAIDDEKVLAQFRESQARLRAMALIHEKLYQSQDLSSIELSEYLRNLTTQLMRTYRTEGKDISVSLDLATVTMDIDLVVPLGLIINELMSNALKYAFEGRVRGMIGIAFARKDDGGYRLEFRDDGVGMSPGIVEQTDRPQSLGMRLVKTLTQQLDGTLVFDVSDGTTVSLEFTVKQERNTRLSL